jgi:L-fuconolactonase
VRIDAHQHFWRYSAGEYPWIDEYPPIDARMQGLARDFLPGDLAPELKALGFDGCVAVQARSSPAENEFLLGLARERDWVRGVVGWVDLCAPDAQRELEPLAREARFKGVRHCVQDEPDDFLQRADFRRGVAELACSGLTYDLLVHARQLEAARRFAAAFPAQPMVLDHLAKPEIAAARRDPWERQFRALAELPHVCCKLSGLVTEARWRAWTPDDLRFYLDVALEAFGERRLLFGSDWPVCLLAAESYRQVFELVHEWAGELSSDARADLFGGNAERFYGLA